MISFYKLVYIQVVVTFLAAVTRSHAFSVHHDSSTSRMRKVLKTFPSSSVVQTTITRPRQHHSYHFSSALNASPEFSVPSQERCVELGIRDWPQTTKSGESWSEEVQEGQNLTRYILQGSGTVSVNSVNKKFNVGVLLEVEGPASLEWKRDASSDSVIILTPGFENGGLFAAALVGFVALCGALVALS